MSFIVAIDGPAGTGKGTITKLIAKDFGLINIDTGATYRCVTLEMINQNVSINEKDKIIKISETIKIDIKNNEEYKAILVSSRVLMDNRQFYIKEFDNNYYYNFKAEYRFFKFIEYYVRTRIFDMKILKNDMAEIQNTGENRNVPAYKRLLTEEYWKIPDEEFLKVINDIIKEILEDICLVYLVVNFLNFHIKYFLSFLIFPLE